MEKTTLHEPVMVDEVLEFLRLKNNSKVLDATVGCGGHAEFILKKIRPDGILIGIDRDRDSLKIAGERLGKFKNVYLKHANFTDIDKVLNDCGVEKVDAALFDLGISSYQLKKPDRGFSFEKESFLDMRMDVGTSLRVYDIVNRYKRDALETIIRDFGQERYFRRIARAVVEKRKEAPIKTTSDLANLIRKAVGGRYGHQKIHPATRTFQALRIAVNGELDNLRTVLDKILDFLNPNGRLCVISFHSLEDGIVKRRFREFKKDSRGNIITKKPLGPKEEETGRNPRSRSAKLRVFEYSG